MRRWQASFDAKHKLGCSGELKKKTGLNKSVVVFGFAVDVAVLLLLLLMLNDNEDAVIDGRDLDVIEDDGADDTTADTTTSVASTASVLAATAAALTPSLL